MIGTLKVFKSCDACKLRKVRCTGQGFPGPCDNCSRRNTECHFSVARAPRRRNRINPLYDRGIAGTTHGSQVLIPKYESSPSAATVKISDVPPNEVTPRPANSFNAAELEAGDRQTLGVPEIPSKTVGGGLSDLYVDRLLSDRGTPQRLNNEKFPFKGNGIFGGDYRLTFFSESRMQSLSTQLGHRKVDELVGKIADVIAGRMKSIDKVSAVSDSPRSDVADCAADVESAGLYIRTFFEHVHPLYPFLDRKAFEETTLGSQLPRLLASNIPFSALYHTVLALGSQYHNGGSFEPGYNKSWGFFSTALALFPDLLIMQDSLLTIQAITAMAIYSMNLQCIQIEYMILSEGARRAQNLGFNRPRGSHDDICNRTFWVLYSLEKHASFYTGRSSVVLDSEIYCPIPYVPDSVIDGFDWFLATARYARLLSRAYSSLFSISVATNPVDYYYTAIDQLMAELERWRLSIPQSIRPGEPFRPYALPCASSTQVALTIHYLYHNFVLALCRAALTLGAEDATKDGPRSQRQSDSQRLLIRTSRSILELCPHIDVEPYTPVWLLAGVPVAALFVLFDLVINNPTHPETASNLALLDVASGHFSRIELATGGTIPGSLVSEFAHIAREYVRDVQFRGAEEARATRWSAPLPQQPVIAESLPAAIAPPPSEVLESANETVPPVTSGTVDSIFPPPNEDPYYMDERFLMGTDVMDLFGSVIPGIDPMYGLSDMNDQWMQAFSQPPGPSS